MTAPKEVPGNTIQSSIDYEAYLIKIGRSMLRTDRMCENAAADGLTVKAIRIKFPDTPGGGYLAVVTADFDGVACVAFHGGTEFHDVVTGLLNRIQNRSLKWKEDNYAK